MRLISLFFCALLLACGGDKTAEPAGDANSGPAPAAGLEEDAPDSAPDAAEPAPEAAPFTLMSSAFEPGDPIPVEYTADGANISPPLRWTGTPEDAAELVLIVDDPDAPGDRPFVHWIMYGIPPDISAFAKEVPRMPRFGRNKLILQGLNDFNIAGWSGPAPPKGKAHNYRFRVYALNDITDLKVNQRIDEVRAAMEGKVIGTAELVATYRR